MTRRPVAEEHMEVQQAISTAALKLFSSQGYDATSVDQIARAAGVSRATVFRRCGTKEDILFARYHDQFDKLRAGVRAQERWESARILRSVLLKLAQRLEEDHDAFLVEVTLMAGNPKLRARALMTVHEWAEVLAHEIARSNSRGGDLQSRVLAHSAVCALQEAICVWHTGKAQRSLVALTNEALRVALPARPRR